MNVGKIQHVVPNNQDLQKIRFVDEVEGYELECISEFQAVHPSNRNIKEGLDLISVPIRDLGER